MGFSWDFGQIPSPVQVIGPETARLGSLREELTGPEAKRTGDQLFQDPARLFWMEQGILSG
jgi:hypothetical protein